MLGAVLTGGASRRMGRDKALLAVDGVALAERVAQALAAAGCAPVILAGQLPGLSALGRPVWPDAPTAGPPHPLRGVCTVLARSTAPRVLFAPCDLPALGPADLAALLAVGGPCVGVVGPRLQPLLCVLGPDHGPRAAALLAEAAPVRALVDGLPRVALSPAAACNLNTPAELAAHLGARREPPAPGPGPASDGGGAGC